MSLATKSTKITKRPMHDSGIAPARRSLGEGGWIGSIPEGWEQKRIAALYDLRNEKCSDKDFAPLSVTMKGILPQLEDVAKTNNGDERKLVRKGDFVINSRSDRRGSCGISDLDGSVSLINTVLCPRGEMNPGYFNWVFHSPEFADEFYAWGHGIVDDLWTTRWSDMKSIVVPFPPLAEQKAIAAFLDRECGRIDGLRTKIEQQIEKLGEYKKSLITEAVTGKVKLERRVGVGEWRVSSYSQLRDSGVSWIGSVPKSWDTIRIGNLYDAVSESGDVDLPILSVSISSGVSDRQLDDEELDRKVCRSEDKTKYKHVAPGDLTYNQMRAWQGAFGTVATEGLVSPAYVVCRPHKTLNTKYIEYVLRTDSAMQEIKRNSTGIVDFRLRLYWSEFKVMKIPFPSQHEQREIAAYLDEKCGAIEAMVEKCRGELEKLAEYKKSLIFECVTGKREVA